MKLERPKAFLSFELHEAHWGSLEESGVKFLKPRTCICKGEDNPHTHDTDFFTYFIDIEPEYYTFDQP